MLLTSAEFVGTVKVAEYKEDELSRYVFVALLKRP